MSLLCLLGAILFPTGAIVVCESLVGITIQNRRIEVNYRY